MRNNSRIHIHSSTANARRSLYTELQVVNSGKYSFYIYFPFLVILWYYHLLLLSEGDLKSLVKLLVLPLSGGFANAAVETAPDGLHLGDHILRA